MTENVSLDIDIRRDLSRLARLSANIIDAHSCFIFVPPQFLSSDTGADEELDYLDLGGYHSLSRDVLDPCRLLRGAGIIGWVAKHRQPIHVSPFEHDSRTLGMYKSDQQLKSFMGVPIPLRLDNRSHETCGVLGCDSKKSYAFSKLQGKLLQDLAIEIAHSIKLSRMHLDQNRADISWAEFLERGQAVVDTLGVGSIEVLRAVPVNFPSLEADLGTGACIELVDQIYRLVQQALPPHFPVIRLPNGDIIMVLDNMMGAYYESRISAITNRVTCKGEKLHFKFYRRRQPNKHSRFDLDSLICSTSNGAPTFKLTKPNARELNYEYRRA
ncbi:MAG: GAF domain-containing protein [Deltaproteobacteria bacterium]|nr:GAF domain-containing protein [Deltaproteobacteria bacterium]